MSTNSINLCIYSNRSKSDCFASRRSQIILRLPAHRWSPLRLHSVSFYSSSEPSVSEPSFIYTVGSSPQWNININQRHELLFKFIACSVAVSTTCLFCAAIPTLLAFKKAADSMAKLMDVTREELPGTMDAVRLSGMEISDLTMELSDLGQQITKGVRGSTRAVRLAEERLHQFTKSTPSASMQEVVTLETKTQGPSVAKTTRSMKETVVKGRAFWKMFFTLTRFSRMAFNYFASRDRSKL